MVYRSICCSTTGLITVVLQLGIYIYNTNNDLANIKCSHLLYYLSTFLPRIDVPTSLGPARSQEIGTSTQYPTRDQSLCRAVSTEQYSTTAADNICYHIISFTHYINKRKEGKEGRATKQKGKIRATILNQLTCDIVSADRKRQIVKVGSLALHSSHHPHTLSELFGWLQSNQVCPRKGKPIHVISLM